LPCASANSPINGHTVLTRGRQRKGGLRRMRTIQIANEGDIGSDNVNEGTVTRLQSLGLVEQRGISLGLTLRGMQSVVRLRRS
jgi:hypothetical protein